EHHSVTSTADTNLSVGRSLVATVKNTISLFAQTLGMKLIAMHGDILVEAQSDNIRVRAKKKIILEADEIEIRAVTKTTVNGGGSYVELKEGAFLEHTSGQWAAHAAKHDLTGPANAPVAMLMEAPPVKEALHFALPMLPGSEVPYAFSSYTLLANGAAKEQGITDEFGKVLIPDPEPGTRYEVKLDNGARYAVPLQEQLARGHSEPAQEQQLSSAGYRRVTDSAQQRYSHYSRPPKTSGA
ncbi:DUF2345 domain-containing protein, partial [Neisseriaceae bacterium TC5R-5]|nr:DUF2345 domain-containing protein [Neisseriaceae bacterium TC5R-5]